MHKRRGRSQDLLVADYNHLFLFFVVACSQACASLMNGTDSPQPHGSQFGYCGSFGHLDSVREILDDT